MRNLKKLFALLLAVVMLLSLAACGGEQTQTPDPTQDSPVAEDPTNDTTAAQVDANLTVHENTYFTVGYNEEDGWVIDEEDIETYDEGGSVILQILDADEESELLVSISASKDDADSQREWMDYAGIDAKDYVDGNVETVEVGGAALLFMDDSYGGRDLFGRNHEAGVDYIISVDNWEDPRVAALLENVTFTASGTDNMDPPWPWEGTAFSCEAKSQTVGAYTVSSTFLPMSEALVTFDTFDHEVAVLGDKVYLLNNDILREYTLGADALTFGKEITLDEEYALIETANGQLVLSGFMADVVTHDGNAVVSTAEGPDNFSIAPDGTWGISWFSAGNDCQKYTVSGTTLTGTPISFAEVDIISSLRVDDSYIYISGSAVADDEHYVFIYDHNGTLKMQLDKTGDDFGLGSVTFATKTASGFLALDGNMRDVVLWDANGTYVGTIEDDDLFGTSYPWFASAAVMEDGSILAIMTETRADESAMELVAFRLTVTG